MTVNSSFSSYWEVESNSLQLKLCRVQRKIYSRTSKARPLGTSLLPPESLGSKPQEMEVSVWEAWGTLAWWTTGASHFSLPWALIYSQPSQDIRHVNEAFLVSSAQTGPWLSTTREPLSLLCGRNHPAMHPAMFWPTQLGREEPILSKATQVRPIGSIWYWNLNYLYLVQTSAGRGCIRENKHICSTFCEHNTIWSNRHASWESLQARVPLWSSLWGGHSRSALLVMFAQVEGNSQGWVPKPGLTQSLCSKALHS